MADQNSKVIFPNRALNFLRNRFGAISEIEVGSFWDNKLEMFEVGLHTNLFKSVNSDSRGVYSIILENDSDIYSDRGDEFYYTVSTWKKQNNRRNISTTNILKFLPKLAKQFIENCYELSDDRAFGKTSFLKLGKPIRVIRCNTLRKKHFSAFAPSANRFRYDGLYKVYEYFPDMDSLGVLVWRFLLKRCDSNPASWIKKNNITPGPWQISNNLLKLIDSDARNADLWKECKNVAEFGKLHFFKKIGEIFTCPKCKDIVILPITPKCGHNLCFECFQNCIFANEFACPQCLAEMNSKLVDLNNELYEALKYVFPGYEFNR